MIRRTTAAAATLVLAAGLAACSDNEPAGPERLSITPVKDGATSGLNPLGDGTRASVAGYTMDSVRLPGASGTGEVSFRILDGSGDGPREDGQHRAGLTAGEFVAQGGHRLRFAARVHDQAAQDLGSGRGAHPVGRRPEEVVDPGPVVVGEAGPVEKLTEVQPVVQQVVQGGQQLVLQDAHAAFSFQ